MMGNCLAISTAWNSNVHSDVKGMLSEIKRVGLDAIEIGYNFTPQRLKELISLVDVMGIKIVSVHNFCPLPSEVKSNRFPTDYYRLSSLDAAERKRAVDYTKKSIDTAASVSCQIVIIHAGRVELENDYERALLHLYNEGKFASEEYLKVKQRLLAARRTERDAYLESAVRSLEEILPYAYSAGIKIGLETRYYPNEIPDIEEIGYLLNLFKDKGLVYWHDVGHAEVGERLGITPHNNYLRRFAHCMLGIHLHDLKGIDDHLAPFSGDFDWSLITPYMRDDLIKVIEAHPPATPRQIKEAVRRLHGGG
jgi:sugar phosphate isomerase/epimerase